jgi:hypothetical protein
MAPANQAVARASAGNRTGRWVVAAVLTLGAASASGQEGQTEYVIEQLIVSVNAAPDGSGDRVDQIKSGDRVEVLEKQGDQSHVRLSSGEEGWVRTSYLSSAPPLRDQLKTRTEELEKLRGEKTKLEADLANARKAATAATAAAASTVSAPAPGPAPASSEPRHPGDSANDSAPATESATPDTTPSNPPMFSSDDGIVPSRPSWLVALAVSLLMLVAGFMLGWRVLDKRIRAKYGGLRIY